ncbi:hypothetical protein ACLB2K_037642 [Fragaria x ananassa]
MGTLVEAENPNSPEGRGRFLRIRVQIDSRHPLQRNLRFNRGNPMLKAQFRYERLSDFCYYCGCLGHTFRFCPQMKDIDSRSIDQSSFMYGDWMRARVARRIPPLRILNNLAPVEPPMEMEAEHAMQEFNANHIQHGLGRASCFGSKSHAR